MKFEFTAEHDALRELVAGLCAQAGNARSCYESDAVIDGGLWNALGEAGLLGVGIAESWEGGGGGPVELVVAAEELGRAVGAVPFSEHAAAAETIARHGSDEQRKRFLVPLARGERVAGIALPEAANLAAIQAHSDGAAWRLTGRLPLIPNAAAASLLVVPAVVGDEVRWFITDAAEITALPTVDRSRAAAAAEFGDASAELLVEAEADAKHRELLLTLAAAEAAGAASTALDMTARYATERQQFGLPIGTFQAVKHRLADMLVEVENARSAVYGAAWALAEHHNTTRSAALAQAVATENAVGVVSDAVQLHGGIGVTWECDLHLYLRRAKALEATYGSPASHRAHIADNILGPQHVGADR